MPNPYTPSNPQNIDLAFSTINTVLQNNISWATNEADNTRNMLFFGDTRQQNSRIKNELFIQPYAFSGNQTGSYDVLTPNSQINGQVFHYVLSETGLKTNNLQLHQYEVKFASIYNVNLQLIYTSEKYGTVRNLIQDILDLTPAIISSPQCNITSLFDTKIVHNNLANIYTPFTWYKQFEQNFEYPNSSFRIEYTMKLNYCSN